MIYLLFIHLAYLDKIEAEIRAAAARQVQLAHEQSAIGASVADLRKRVQAAQMLQLYALRSSNGKKIVLRKMTH
jgi:hypothetical protein